ncbi:aminoglycoside phosphotransferase [Nocardioides rubriscoriae]|uniref:aminoglycoside phosphotransferase n=1 Tax=Nocardioides rubriscoriae TaxID=642762 RepID=UPI0011E034C2|nr:aminoglycoside phosphotransferase [Nocardioides rubriscoriae]
MIPPPEVLDLFAVPEAPEPLPGGRGASFRAGDLVLSPGREGEVAQWLYPMLARLSVRLDEAPGRRRRDLRVALPVPARDGSWVVDGWGATRWEPGATTCEDLEVTLAAGRLLHAQLDAVVRSRPPGLDRREDRWARAERLVFGPTADLLWALDGTASDVVALLEDVDLGREQLVHADLAGNVLIDGGGAPLVIDVAPAWRAPRWAEAVCVLDSVLWWDADRTALAPWRHGADRQAMLRAILFRALADGPGHDEPYLGVLDLLG